MEKMNQSVIYIGLNDSVTHEQKFETEKYISILKNVCMSYHVAFSVNKVNGGYFHEDGSYVEENTLELTVLGQTPKMIREIATDLCTFFHQESVMVTSSEAEVYFVQDQLLKKE